MVFEFLFGKAKSYNDQNKKEINIKKEEKIVYLVVNKGSQVPIGIFSSLELAKKQGEKSTYYNCQIIEFIIDDKCKYLANPIYEN